MSNVPDDLRYTKSHEWVRMEGNVAVIGITDHAQEALNDIVYVELPKVGAEFAAEAEFGVVESVKSVSDLYAPLAGKIVAVNGVLEDEPELLNEDPYGKGWMIKLQVKDPAAAKALLTGAQYKAIAG